MQRGNNKAARERHGQQSVNHCANVLVRGRTLNCMTCAPSPIRAVMFFVDDQLAAARWYREHVLGGGDIIEDEGYVFIERGGVEVGFHPSDTTKNPQGASVVAYFSTSRLDAQREALIAAGATPLRGPLDITDERAICQLIDPFGNVLGLDGPRSRSLTPHVPSQPTAVATPPTGRGRAGRPDRPRGWGRPRQ